MKRNDRAHRILGAIAAGPIRVAELKRRVADGALRRSIDHARTWDTCLQMAELGLVVIRHGMVGTTGAGRVARRETEQGLAPDDVLAGGGMDGV